MTYVTEKIKIRVDRNCREGIYLKWENDYGAVDQYFFDGNITQQAVVDETQYFDQNVDDLDGVTENFEVVSKKYDESYTCFATFDKRNIEAFRQLIRSRNIFRWDDPDWLRVDVQLVSFVCEKDKPYGKIQLKVIPNRVYVK